MKGVVPAQQAGSLTSELQSCARHAVHKLIFTGPTPPPPQCRALPWRLGAFLFTSLLLLKCQVVASRRLDAGWLDKWSEGVGPSSSLSPREMLITCHSALVRICSRQTMFQGFCLPFNANTREIKYLNQLFSLSPFILIPPLFSKPGSFFHPHTFTSSLLPSYIHCTCL